MGNGPLVLVISESILNELDMMACFVPRHALTDCLVWTGEHTGGVMLFLSSNRGEIAFYYTFKKVEGEIGHFLCISHIHDCSWCVSVQQQQRY